MINKKLFIVLVFIGNFLHANNSLDSLFIELERKILELLSKISMASLASDVKISLEKAFNKLHNIVK